MGEKDGFFLQGYKFPLDAFQLFGVCRYNNNNNNNNNNDNNDNDNNNHHSENMSAAFQETTKLENYRKQPYWALHTLRKVLT
jgi:pullulanase/glycogen debranching enzyme